MSLTRADMNLVLTEVDVLCDLVVMDIRTYMPVGLGDAWLAERDELVKSLRDVKRRFRRSIRDAQRVHGWAAK